jgi:hypothetical protein
MSEYDARYWKHGLDITVGELCDYMKEHIPSDAIFHVCGDSQVYLHFSPEGKAFSVDNDSLSELSEYDGCEVEELEMGQKR